jgi:hypothetical protein
MSDFVEITIAGWGTASSSEKRQHYWQWNGRREFTTLCENHRTRYRPRQKLILARCKACERRREALS